METSGTLLSSTRWTDEQPPIYISATYETEDRTPTNVAVRVILSVSAVNGLNYFGYNIRARIGFPGLTTDWVTVKNNSPSQWSTPYTYDFGWHTISQSAASTSFSATIYMDTNSGARTTSYSGHCLYQKRELRSLLAVQCRCAVQQNQQCHYSSGKRRICLLQLECGIRCG